METTLKLSAVLIANQLDIKGIKSFLTLKPLADSSTELLYGFGDDHYQYYFNYGVLVSSGYSWEEIKQAVNAIQPYQRNPLQTSLRDDYEIKAIPGSEMAFGFEQLTVDHLDARVIRIAMFNLAQSVALDHYHGVSETLLTEVRTFTRGLENTGKLLISRKNMLKFIGKALNTQNDIAENIYIFDAPELVWDDEYLDALHKGLLRHFELRVRFSEFEYTLRIIEDNLRVFREISNQRQSNTLEWIIIVLILVEISHLFLSKLF